MSNDLKTKQSKYISLLLRHKPEAGNLTLDQHGWCDVRALIKAVKDQFKGFSLADLEDIVTTDEKQRYAFNDTKTKIRANQGHSINVDVEFKELIPTTNLYHGTATRYLDSIMRDGLTPQSRQWVHLTDKLDEAILTGSRHGTPVVLVIDVAKMIEDGYKFYISANNRYMIKHVPAKYIINMIYQDYKG